MQAAGYGNLNIMIELIVTIVCVALPVLLGVLGFVNRRSWKALVQGIGLALLPLACYFIGITELAVHGVGSIIDWVQRTVWTPRIQNATIMAGIGVVLLILGHFLTNGTPRQAAKTDKPQPGPKETKRAAAPAAPKPAVGSKAPKSGLDPEDEEIEALLRSHGIE